MKTLGRTIAILLTALLVVGATVVLTPSGYAQGLFPSLAGLGGFEARERGQAPRDPAAGNFDPAGRPAGPGGFERGEARGGSLFGLGELLRPLVIIAAIVAVVATLARFARRRRPRAAAPPPAAATDAGPAAP